MIQVISRAGAILRALEGHPGGRSVGDVAADVGVPRSSVHRILKALEQEHLVSSGPDDGGFRLGPALLRLASSAGGWTTGRVHAVLEQLAAEIDETVDLAVRAGTSAYFVDQVAAGNRLQAVSAVGLHFPLHCTANGKALLSGMGDDEVVDILGRDLERLTPNTIVSVDALLGELETVRASGVAVDREEHHAGISAVGTLLENPYGLPAALSVPVPTSRFVAREAELGEQLLAGRARIEAALAAP